MKKQRTLCAVLFVLVGLVLQLNAAGQQRDRQTQAQPPAQTTTGWRQFTSQRGHFSVVMPGTPQEQTQEQDFPVVGKGIVHLFGLTEPAGVYLATYVEVPGLAQQNQEFIDEFGKGFLQNIGEATAQGAEAKVIKETDISFGKYPGKEILIEGEGGIATIRAYFINKVGYELVVAPPAALDSRNVRRFLDSFVINP